MVDVKVMVIWNNWIQRNQCRTLFCVCFTFTSVIVPE